MKTALTIAGADPSGFAGVQADIAVFRDLGVLALSAITALTAQNRREVTGVAPVKAAFLEKQIMTLAEEFSIDAVKIGMLGSCANLTAIARIASRGVLGENIVLDTVFRSTGGRALLDRKGVASVRKLLAHVKLVTPNIQEAAIISGAEVNSVRSMEKAARLIHSMGPACVLVTGGHLAGPPVDVLFDGRDFSRFRGKRVDAGKEALHGTGCVLSAAIAALLAKGHGMEAAIRGGKRHLEKTLASRATRP